MAPQDTAGQSRDHSLLRSKGAKMDLPSSSGCGDMTMTRLGRGIAVFTSPLGRLADVLASARPCLQVNYALMNTPMLAVRRHINAATCSRLRVKSPGMPLGLQETV